MLAYPWDHLVAACITTHVPFLFQLWIYAIPAGVTFIATIIAFWYKEPAIPPAPSGERDHIPSFWRGLLDVRAKDAWST